MERKMLYYYDTISDFSYFYAVGDSSYDKILAHIASVEKHIRVAFGNKIADEYIYKYMEGNIDLHIDKRDPKFVDFRNKLGKLLSPYFDFNFKFTSKFKIDYSRIESDVIAYDKVSQFCGDFHKINKILDRINGPVNYFNTIQFTIDHPGIESHNIRNDAIDILDRVSKFYPDSIIPKSFFERERRVFNVCDGFEFSDINRLYTDLIADVRSKLDLDIDNPNYHYIRSRLITSVRSKRDLVINHPDYQQYRQCIYDDIANRLKYIDYRNLLTKSIGVNVSIKTYLRTHSFKELFTMLNIDITSDVILNAYNHLPQDSHKFVYLFEPYYVYDEGKGDSNHI